MANKRRELIVMTETKRNDTAVMDVVREVVDSTTAGKVFGAPIEKNGMTVLPVAKVGGGGGGGGGNQSQEGQEAGGTGGGLGVSAKPLGVFVIKDGDVSWRPAVDLNRVVLGGQIVAVVALLVIRAMIKARRR